MARDIAKIYDQMISDMCSIMPEDGILDTCLASLNPEAIRHVPLRYRIIALGFARHMSLHDLNDLLIRQGCPRLYSRSFMEATLIFAFQNGWSYEQWKEMQRQCRDIYSGSAGSVWFGEKKITYEQLEHYVQENSLSKGDMLCTQMRTRLMEQGLMGLNGDAAALRAFLHDNVDSFSTVREKTRYYFCKYLYYWLNRRIENYFLLSRMGKGTDEALSELFSLKVVTALRRKQTLPEEQKREMIRSSALSCGEIFDAFNYFYFGYVSVDWVEALIECYRDVDSIPQRHMASLAQVFRKGRPEWEKLSDSEVIRRRIAEVQALEDESYSRSGSRGYGKNREGELALYKYIQGTGDIDRTVLLCFLLFFASDGEMPDDHRLNVERLQTILSQCGYAPLDIENDFDWFVVEFLESRNPVQLLTDIMEGYARQHENSFLYHVYGKPVQYEEELVRVMLEA